MNEMPFHFWRQRLSKYNHAFSVLGFESQKDENQDVEKSDLWHKIMWGVINRVRNQKPMQRLH